MSTLKEIAEKVGVSITTVSKVLGGLEKEGRISPERAKEIRRVAEKLGYVPHAAARATRTRKTYHIGVLLRNAPDSPNFIMAHFETLLGINQRLAPENYVTSLVRFHEMRESMRDQSRVFREQVVDGLITLSTCIEPVNRFVSSHFPNVIWVDGLKRDAKGCIWRDEISAGRLVARHLRKGGAKRIVWIGLPPGGAAEHYSRAEREKGLREGAGSTPVKMLHITGPGRDIAAGGVLETLRAEIAKGRVGVACYCYLTARSVLANLAMFGLAPGRDYALAACDETSDTRMVTPLISRCAFDRYDMGQQAAEMMLALLAGGDAPPSRILPVTWVPGKTCAFGDAD